MAAVDQPVPRASPLAGVRVLDLTNVLAGPFCCHQLAHLGAEVIKVEAASRDGDPASGGDLARRLGADADLNARGMGVSFLAQNAGKKSVTLNLKDPRGADLLRSLVQTADVLVENFRPGVMDRLGVGYATLRVVKPTLIYAAITGFGQDGPWSNRPAYDQIVQGAAGVMSVTGAPDGEPTRVGYPVSDTIGGLTAAFAIAAALNAPERGGFVDVSMQEATLATMGWVVSNWLIAGVAPARLGNENMTAAPSGAFRTNDGLLNIAANQDAQWERLARHLGREDLLERLDFATREARKKNRAALNAELEASLAAKSAAAWEAELTAIGVPAGAVLDVADALAHPQIAERGLIGRFEAPDGVARDIDLLRAPLRIDGARPTVETPPPTLGRDNDAVWGALGLDAETLEAYRRDGVI